MPRKGPVPKRDVLPDPVYHSKLVTRFINKVMLDGKKGIAESIVYDAFDIIRSKMNKDPMEVFEQALNNVMPVLEVRARRVAAPTIRFPLKYGRIVASPSVFVGLSAMPASAVNGR